MDTFFVNKTFDSFEDFTAAKKSYQDASCTILTISQSHKFKAENSNAQTLVYERANFMCKAGTERRSKSSGIRQSSTNRKNCPFKLNIVSKGNKIVVTVYEGVHENHACDRETFLHYTENMKLTPEMKDTTVKYLECGANPAKIQYQLMNLREAPVCRKQIHNLQTAINKKNSTGEGDLMDLLSMMQKVEGATIKVAYDEDNELIGIYYQDARMAALFDKFPEVIIYDATYRLNDRRMPLFVMLVVDGAGESEVASLWIIKSESKVCAETILEFFKECNRNWTKIKVVISK